MSNVIFLRNYYVFLLINLLNTNIYTTVLFITMKRCFSCILRMVLGSGVLDGQEVM